MEEKYAIGKNDLIRGELYLKLIADYKAYDAKQKKLIAQLKAENKTLRAKYESAVNGNLDLELKALRKQVIQLSERISQQRKQLRGKE